MEKNSTVTHLDHFCEGLCKCNKNVEVIYITNSDKQTKESRAGNSAMKKKFTVVLPVFPIHHADYS